MSGQGKPPFVSRSVPKYAAHILLPASKLLKPVPIRVWAYETTDGWHGWLNTQRKPGAKVLPSFWAKSNWKETNEAGAQKAIAKVTAEAEAKRTAETAAQQTEVQPAKRRGKAAEPVATAGKAKPGPVKAAAKAPEPQPEPPQPTGTDPGTPADASALADTLTQAIQVLGPTETLKAIATTLKGPGLRKAAAKPAAVPARKRAGGKR